MDVLLDSAEGSGAYSETQKARAVANILVFESDPAFLRQISNRGISSDSADTERIAQEWTSSATEIRRRWAASFEREHSD